MLTPAERHSSSSMRENVASRAIAEELSQSFFVIGNAMLLNERDEICGSVAGQG